jgi:cell division protein ZapA
MLKKDKPMKDNSKEIKSILVEIFGEEYQIASEAASVDIQQVAAYVDRKMQEVAGRSGSGQKSSLAVLAAMEITAELLRVRQENEQLLKKAYDSIDRLSELIDQRSTLLPLTSDWMEERVDKQHF